MTLSEILRTSFVTLVGVAFLFLVQPFLYSSGLAPRTGILIDGKPISIDEWLDTYYRPAALIVLSISLVAQVSWYAIAITFKKSDRKAVEGKGNWWRFLLLLVFVGIGFALSLNKSQEMMASIAFFFIIDSALIYWLATAISTPGLLQNVPPGAIPLYKLFKL